MNINLHIHNILLRRCSFLMKVEIELLNRLKSKKSLKEVVLNVNDTIFINQVRFIA